MRQRKIFRQDLLNLLGNAIKFAQQGKGALCICSECLCFGVLVECLSIENCKLMPLQLPRFKVEDTGMGITPAQLDKIFPPFNQFADAQHQAAGTGLGLAISQFASQLKDLAQRFLEKAIATLVEKYLYPERSL